MNKLSTERRTEIVAALVEGNSVRATCPITGAAKGTVLKLLAELGRACAKHHNATVRNVEAKRVQCDEIWSFVGVKERNLRPELRGTPGLGALWTWVGLDQDSKLTVSWLVGDRGPETGFRFVDDLAARLATRVQLTTDGHSVYLQAVENALAGMG